MPENLQKLIKIKKPPIIIGAILALFVAVFLIGIISTSLSGGSAIKVVSAQNVFQSDETPQFIFIYKKQANIFNLILTSLRGFFTSESIKINASVKIFDSNSRQIDGLNPQIKQEKNGKLSVELDHSKFQQELRPGQYEMVMEITDNGKTYTQTQDFYWGVLAINTNKSIYLPDEEAYLQFASLDKEGHTLCNSKLELQIQTPNSKTQILSTNDGTIKYSGECKGDNVTEVPDYFAYYNVSKTGKYEMKLTNLDNGFEITDYFEVRDSVEFDVERSGPTRIWPYAKYEVKIKIKANQDFSGEIVETVPMTFIIEEKLGAKIEPLMDNYTKIITWQAEIKKDETKEFIYTFDAPNVSPYFYLLGPLRLKSQAPMTNDQFIEARQWQIAADAETEQFIIDNDITTNSCGSGCWQVPSDWNSASNSIETIGGGGGGGDSASNDDTGGGGGGAYANGVNLDYIAGAQKQFGIGASGSGGFNSGSGTDGGNTYFNATSLANCETVGSESSGSNGCVGAEGGKGGTNADGGAGGDDQNSVGNTLRKDGGAGGAGCVAGGQGGGGGAGGPHGIGGAGANGTGDANPGLGGGGGGGGGGTNGSVGSVASASTSCTGTGTTSAQGGGGGTNWLGVDDGMRGGIGADLFGGAASAGGGGGGGDDGGYGGVGGNGKDWTASYGSGGGGGGAGDTENGGYGGNYGGGGGGGETCTAAECHGAGGLIHIAYTPLSFTVSGTCKQYDQSSNSTETPMIKVAVNTSINGTTGSCSAGAWTVTLSSAPVEGDVITVWAGGVNVDNRAVAVTLYDGSGYTISGIPLYEHHLSIGSADNIIASNSDLAIYDNSISTDADIFFDVNGGNGLIACVNAGCENAEVYIVASNKYALGSASARFAEIHDIEIDGTFDMTGTGNYASISGSWWNDATFTPNTSTIFFMASDSTELVSQSTDGTYAFYNVQFGDNTTTSYTGHWDFNGNATMFDVNGNLAIEGGTLHGLKNINLAGNLTIELHGDYLRDNYTLTFDGTTTPVTWADSRAAPADMGMVSINGTTKRVALGSSVKANELTIAASQILDLGSSGYILTIGGDGTSTTRPFQNSGTLDCGTNSTVQYIASQSTDIEDTDYFNLKLASASTTFTITGSAATIVTSGSFTIDYGTFNGGDDTVTLKKTGTGAISISDTFTPATGTINYAGNGATTVASMSATGYYNLEIGNATTQTAARTYTLEANITVSGTLLLGPDTGSFTHILSASTFTLTLSGTGTPFQVNNNGSFTSSTSTVSYTGNGATTIASASYYTLSIGTSNNANITYSADGNQTVTNQVNLQSAGSGYVNTFDLVSYNLGVGSTTNNSGRISVPIRSALTQSGGTTTVQSSNSGLFNIGGSGTTTFYNFIFGSGNRYYELTMDGDIGVSGSFEIESSLGGTYVFLTSYELAVWGNFTVSDANGFFTSSGTLTFSGTTNTTYTINGSCALNDVTINKTNAGTDNVTLADNLQVSTLTITDGRLVQGNYRVWATAAVSVGINGEWNNIGTGDLTLGGTFANSGTVVFNTSNNGCTGGGIADGIEITSNAGGTQRNWTSTSPIEMYNVSVTDMTSTPDIIVYSGTFSNVGPKWALAKCSDYSTPYNRIKGSTRIKGGTRVK